jgi:hypothetical protein
MKIRQTNIRVLLVPLLAIGCLGIGACASSPRSHTTVRETERVYRDSDEVCREKVVTEQRRDRRNDRTRVASTETVCRDR